MNTFFTIITVTYNDEWALSKTLRSIFSQSFKDFELIVVDGNSTDSTSSLVSFWRQQGLIHNYIRESDNGVYDAMNKGVRYASGEYILYLNSGDVFFSNDTLAEVYEILSNEKCDALMGWGELNGQIWSSWVVSQAFRLASLGFCHQSLYVKRALLEQTPFDARPFKTDSDIMQLADIITSNNLRLVDKLLSIRSGDEGVSANLSKTKKSIEDSILSSKYRFSESDVETVLSFRRGGDNFDRFVTLLSKYDGEHAFQLCLVTLDTLCQPQSKRLSESQISELFKLCISILDPESSQSNLHILEDFLRVQEKRSKIGLQNKVNRLQMNKRISSLRVEAKNKFGNYNPESVDDFIVSLTTFPKRISSVHLVIESLLRQTRRPSKIYLNIGRDEFKNESWLPSQLLELKSEGLIINLVDKTTHQYDKFLHIHKENNKKPLVIVDDDVIYPPKSMEYLLIKHQAYPNYIVSNRPHLMHFNDDGTLAPYSEWPKEVSIAEPSHNLFPTGAGGVLYPVNFFDKDLVCNKAKILRLAPYADDVWLKFCAIKKSVLAVCSDMLVNERWYYRYTPQMTEGALHKENVDLGMNDMQIALCMKNELGETHA